MTTKEQLIQAIEQAPEALVEEVFNFLLFTQSRQQQKLEASTLEPDTLAAQLSQSGEAANGETLLELFDRITADMTDEEIAQLPEDGAEQHDHYIYGIPKRPQ